METLMAQNKYALARYYIIDSLLRKFKYVKTAFMTEYCREKIGYTVSRRTIQLDVEAMKNDSFLGFYAPINYCKKRKAFYYENPDYRLSLFVIRVHEIQLLETVFDNVCHSIDSEQYYMIKHIIQRLKVLAVE